jgi:hypothetical protein
MEGCRPWKSRLEQFHGSYPGQKSRGAAFLEGKAARESSFAVYTYRGTALVAAPAVPSNMLNVNVRYPPIALDLSKT